jgi:hypothetical protein
MKYEVTLKCICVEVAEDGTRRTLLDDGPTWKGLPYKGMVAIQQMMIKVITGIGSWGLANLTSEEAQEVSAMMK